MFLPFEPESVSPKRINLSREAKLHEVSGIIGHEFRDLGLLHRALSHSSLGNEGLPDYERLEFLGDAVLGFLVAECLYKRKPEVPEGELTSRRSLMVSRRPLAMVAEELNLGTYLLVGRGLTDESIRSPRILADLVEAVLAAVYLDGGIRAARRFVQVFVIERFQLDQEDLRGTTDPKTRLNQWAQAKNLGSRDDGPRPRSHVSGGRHPRPHHVPFLRSEEQADRRAGGRSRVPRRVARHHRRPAPRRTDDD